MNDLEVIIIKTIKLRGKPIRNGERVDDTWVI